MADKVAVSCNYFDEMTHLGKVHKRFLWISAIAYFFDQMDQMLFGKVAAPVQHYFNLTLTQMGTLNSLSFWGMFFGGIFGGWLADKIGRKKSLLISIAIFSGASICNAFFHNFWLFGACRFFTGFGAIGVVIIAMVYITEMMPSHSRGKYQGLAIASGTISVPISAFIAAWIIPMGPEAWRIIFILGGLGILAIPLGASWLRESPRWLVLQGRVEEAEAIVAECVGHAVNLREQAANCHDSKVKMSETFKFVFSKNQLKNTLVMSAISIGGVCGGFYLANWNINLLVQMGFPLATLLLVAAFSTLAAPIGDFASAFISDKGGRKTPIVIFLFLSTFFLLLIGMFPGVISFGVLSFFRSACATCMMTTFWTYLAESLPNRYRSSATGIIMSFSRVLVAIVTPTVPIIFANFGWMGVQSANAVFYIIPAFVALFFGAKTAQKTLEQIEAESTMFQAK